MRRWNIGGWGNTCTTIELKTEGFSGAITKMVPYHVESGVWYDLRVDVIGKEIKCYVDGKLVLSEIDSGAPQSNIIYATASRDNAGGDVIIKAVNTANIAHLLYVMIDGTKVNRNAQLTLLAGQTGDINSIAEPEKVKPVTTSIRNASNDFTQLLPANSVSVIRLSTKK